MDTSLEGLYPHVYKRPLRRVNSNLVEIVGKFTPRIVRMADEAGEF